VGEVAATSTATAIEAGVMVLPGTDAGTPFNPPGQLVDEMTLLRDLGMTNAGVIVAATSVAAAVFGWYELGVLEAGKVADLLLVEGNPLEDLGTLAWPLTIVQNGVVI
jgi:imidazolonepropionase-like amidohydrolase